MLKETNSQTNEDDNVISFATFREKKTPVPVPVKMITFGDRSYPWPKTSEQYLQLVKDVIWGQYGCEEEYQAFLCAIMDDEYYQASYNYWQTNNARNEVHNKCRELIKTLKGAELPDTSSAGRYQMDFHTLWNLQFVEKIPSIEIEHPPVQPNKKLRIGSISKKDTNSEVIIINTGGDNSLS